MIHSFNGKYLLIRQGISFLLVAGAGHRFSLCIETPSDEYCQGIGPDDLLVVSAPEGGEPEAAVMLIELLRRFHTPLVVLPKDHPGSKRLRYVVSAGPVIEANCSIRRGTHPEQHLICASAGLSGMTLRSVPGGCEMGNLPPGAIAEVYIPVTLNLNR